MSVPPLVSVIIPCHNAEPWLAATLDSVLAQTWHGIEIIVIDDESSDGSPAIAQDYQSRGVRTIRVSNGGAAAARNHGIQLARGDYFQFLDADDLLAPDKLERQLARLIPAGPETVANSAWARFQKLPAEAVFVREILWQDYRPVEWLVTSWEKHAMMATATWLVPRLLVEKAGPWNTSFGRHNPVDDMEYFARIVLASRQVIFCGEAQVYYRSGLAGSLSRRRDAQTWKAIYGSFHLTADRLLAIDASPTTRHAVATAMQYLVYESYPRVPGLRRAARARIAELGGTDLSPDAGPKRRLFQALIGWKATKRLHDWRQHSSRSPAGDE